MGHLKKYLIATAANWQMLSDADNADIKKAGLPAAVINDLNDAVRVDLLLPAFKYADKVEFLKEGDHMTHPEVKSIIEYAFGVDAKWILDRTECQSLCEEIRAMVELTQKYRLKRWSRFESTNRNGVTTFFPHSHYLVTLHNALRSNIPTGMSLAGCPPSALVYISQCGEFTRFEGAIITCSELFEHMRVVDPYLFDLWNGMQRYSPVR